ncbi:glycosyl transferase [Nocardia farcinica]|uniref:glycosyl transferase n=1 Tax=Nocardia farcinica TaxID=37329 RepID=UPI000A3BBA2E|nr:glycosyl transferase [Nocardia farcinica]MBF6141649.1 glycosyl transferase [Nocardia farcinica]MBF6255405.1 glycosyl transferase [Nocardia farcinica]MBF6290835.1 glycosyl transferase [Nocardia farcinica]MBF6380293.1 glycosyl transferase [Nocardia farcinica]MBF6385233.1 glycosyl transferase [Nocardia farcinica]
MAPTRETAEPTTIVRGRPPRIRTAWRPATAARALVPERGDLLVGLIYLALAAAVLSGQWRDTSGGYLIKSGQDQTMWEWFFAVTAHSLAHLENPLGTTLQNFPAGVNMMANTAMFGVGVPLAPITLLFGPTVTFVLVLTLGLATTAYAWYRLFAAELVRSRAAAALGGLFCGFAPGMVSHANAHPNFVVLALLPVIAGLVIRLARVTVAEGGGVRWRSAVALGLLVAGQIALGEEPLLIFALAFAVFAVVYHARAPRAGLRAARAIAPTVAVAAGITLVLTAVPLWWQFFGPQSYRSIDHGPMGNDLKAMVQFPSESLGGLLAPGQPVAINPTEQNAYFGWPLLLLVGVIVALLWRDRVVRAAAAVIAVFGLLSLGASATLGRRDTGIALPWRWAEHVPLLNTVLESRLALAAVPAIAILLALVAERAVASWRTSLTDWKPLAWFAAVAAALVPLTPTVLPVTEREPTPRFFTEQTVRAFTGDGSVVLVPPPRPADARALRWQSDADFVFPLAGGYFVGPTGADKKGVYGPPRRPTTDLLVRAQDTGSVPPIGAAEQAAARADLRYWRADVLVLPATKNADVLAETVTRLLGAGPVPVADVRVWDVRGLR